MPIPRPTPCAPGPAQDSHGSFSRPGPARLKGGGGVGAGASFSLARAPPGLPRGCPDRVPTDLGWAPLEAGHDTCRPVGSAAEGWSWRGRARGSGREDLTWPGAGSGSPFSCSCCWSLQVRSPTRGARAPPGLWARSTHPRARAGVCVCMGVCVVGGVSPPTLGRNRPCAPQHHHQGFFSPQD